MDCDVFTVLLCHGEERDRAKPRGLACSLNRTSSISIDVPNPTNDHELWFMNKRTRSRSPNRYDLQGGWAHHERQGWGTQWPGRSSEWSRCSCTSRGVSWGGTDTFFTCLLDTSLEKCFGHVPMVGRPRTCWRDCCLLAGQGTPRGPWRRWLRPGIGLDVSAETSDPVTWLRIMQQQKNDNVCESYPNVSLYHELTS